MVGAQFTIQQILESDDAWQPMARCGLVHNSIAPAFLVLAPRPRFADLDAALLFPPFFLLPAEATDADLFVRKLAVSSSALLSPFLSPVSELPSLTKSDPLLFLLPPALRGEAECPLKDWGVPGLLVVPEWLLGLVFVPRFPVMVDDDAEVDDRFDKEGDGVALVLVGVGG